MYKFIVTFLLVCSVAGHVLSFIARRREDRDYEEQMRAVKDENLILEAHIRTQKKKYDKIKERIDAIKKSSPKSPTDILNALP